MLLSWGACSPVATCGMAYEPGNAYDVTGSQENVDVWAAGLVINTMGFIENLGYELLLHAISALRADIVLVLGQERLFNQLRTHLK